MAMNWYELNTETRAEIERLLTEKQLLAYRLSIAGYGHRRIAVILGIGRQAARDRVSAAEAKLRTARILDRTEDGWTNTGYSHGGGRSTRAPSARPGSPPYSSTADTNQAPASRPDTGPQAETVPGSEEYRSL
jgi:hypothetical protein